MKYLGIDYGEKRVGIALSDSEEKIAFPKEVLFNNPNMFAKLKYLVEKEGVARVVVGIPFSAAGKDTGQAEVSRQFSHKLQEILGITVELENEFLTTKIAEEHSQKDADASAAALILQSHLDRINRK